MMPVLFTCPLFTIYSYGFFVALAFFVATFFLLRDARQRHISENLVYDLCIILLVAGILSARVFYVVLNWDAFRTNLIEIVMLQHGGLVWFGGFIGALISGIFFMRIKKMSVWATLDLLAPFVVLAHAIGRIGCFFNGCCYGKESSFGFYSPLHHVTLFPAQLVDALTLGLVFFILRFFSGRVKTGVTFSFYLILASLQRFLMEFIRGDERAFYFGLSIFQWISLGLFLCGSMLVLYLCRKKIA